MAQSNDSKALTHLFETLTVASKELHKVVTKWEKVASLKGELPEGMAVSYRENHLCKSGKSWHLIFFSVRFNAEGKYSPKGEYECTWLCPCDVSISIKECLDRLVLYIEKDKDVSKETIHIGLSK